jgi:two-component system, OmpR family, KDP operon response regulator KdpE
VVSATSGAEALAAYTARRPDLVLLDLGLPDVDGLELVERIRAHAATPIVVLSARGAERDKVRALDLGADDYLTKPFGVEELLARIRVALRHAARPTSGSAPVFRCGDLAVDLERRQVTVGGQEVKLTPTEYALLRAFITHPDKVLTRRMLLQEVWGPEYGTEAHYLHVYVASLRRKLEADPQRPRYLLTDPGVGYRFRADPAG